MSNMVNKAHSGDKATVKLPIGETAAARFNCKYSRFFWKISLKKRNRGNKQWLIRNPEEAQILGKAIKKMLIMEQSYDYEQK